MILHGIVWLSAALLDLTCLEPFFFWFSIVQSCGLCLALFLVAALETTLWQLYLGIRQLLWMKQLVTGQIEVVYMERL